MAYTNFTNCTEQEYLDIIYSQDETNRIRIWFNDTELENAGEYCESLKGTNRILPNDGKKIFTLDNFISKEYELVLRDLPVGTTIEDQVRISIGTLVGENTYEDVPIGVFNIQDTPVTDQNKVTIKLRDNRVKFDFNYNAQPLIDSQGGTATKMEILEDICEQAGVTNAIESFSGEDDEVGIYDSTITATTYVSYLLEQAGLIPTIDREGQLIAIDVSDLKTWHIPLDIVEKYEKGEPYQIERVVYESGIIKYETSNDESLDTLYLNAANPYITTQEQVINVYDIVKDFKIDSATTGKVLGNPAIDPYDMIEIYDSDREELPTTSKSGKNITFNNSVKDKMKITLGSTELTQAGTPTPSSPQDIHCISGSNTIKVEGKNIYLGSQDFSGTWNNNSAWTTDSETYNGLVVKKRTGSWNGISKDINVESGKTYVFSVYIKCDTARQVALYTSGGTSGITTSTNVNATTTWTRYSLTINATASGTIRPRVENTTTSDTNNTYICGYQLEQNSSMTDYTPYVSQEAEVDLDTIEYCKIGTYADRIFKNISTDTDYSNTREEGAWYKKKKIGKVVIDGTEGWTFSSSNVLYKNNFLNYLSSASLLCKYYSYGGIAPNSSGAYPKGNNTFSGNNDGKTLYFRNDSLTDLTSWENWLSTNKPEIWYVIPTPTYTKITGTLANQLENVYQKMLSYDNTTNISQINNDLAFQLGVQAYNDSLILKTLANNNYTYNGVHRQTFDTQIGLEERKENVTINGEPTFRKWAKTEIDNTNATIKSTVEEITTIQGEVEGDTVYNLTTDETYQSGKEYFSYDSETDEYVLLIEGVDYTDGDSITGDVYDATITDSLAAQLQSLKEELPQIQTTILEQTSTQFQMLFTQTGITDDLKIVSDLLNDTLDENKDGSVGQLMQYIKFEGAMIELGKSDSPVKLRIANDRISFMTGDNESAYISENQLYITDSTILNKLRVGHWETKEDENHNLNTRWVDE